ncbi:Rpn family recombination-promoting nuclease/putative transposase [Anaerostipes hadrus]|jgi:predicted transposase/invertase (TIGR01784 family)|uniref:Rpn family recombination-promoting nuclease/putative transposase n=1 Tax=Anaerostipes hadrus TaxID=649756 RepID=UPI00156E35B5|nr:Rpn family recombination-promoting nuclease/putative transposase [Anaerostipes hadrus]NSH01104.1 Rpn family recombination-promoting nuclease/putative transposase [Anaerostipes hadrus]
MSKNKKSLQDLTLLDRFLFAEVMEDPKTFENILSIILGEDISIKGRPQSEHENRTSPLKRQVRLDVWAEDETDAVYNVEAQKENTKNLPHRSRFYQALIDSKLLDPGEVDFSNMKDCYSIIIAPFDLFGRGLYQYTFQMTCAETGQPLEDGATRIFLNTHGKNSEDISPELKELLYYMEHTTEEISCSTSRLQEIKNHVNVVKSSEEIGVKYMQEWEEKILEKRKARAEGRAEGETFRLIQLIKKKIQKSKSFIQIADELEEEPDNIQSLYECISQNINLTTEEIYKIYILPDKTED